VTALIRNRKRKMVNEFLKTEFPFQSEEKHRFKGAKPAEPFLFENFPVYFFPDISSFCFSLCLREKEE